MKNRLLTPALVAATFVISGCENPAPHPTQPDEASQPQFAHGTPEVTYDPALYTALEVFARDAFSPSINNNGEIAYTKQFPGVLEPRIFTTLQGDVTFPGTIQVRFPGINDLGEVVYSAISGPGGFHLFSSRRGRLTPHGFRGNLPSINNLGVAAFKNDGGGRSSS